MALRHPASSHDDGLSPAPELLGLQIDQHHPFVHLEYSKSINKIITVKVVVTIPESITIHVNKNLHTNIT